MKVSQFPISTLRETPAEAELSSHQLMLKAGLIRQLASGLYTWGPYGLRVLKRVENIVREEMDKAGAVEMLMPTVQPAELWQESGRWEEYGKELLRITDRHQRDFCYGPTHEEIITDYARNVINSYKELPINFYQIQWKFRDEVRPRFGLMRSREFLMKDAYSFHLGQESLQKTYDTMHQAYSAVFTRLGLQFRAVEADNGSIGGSGSHEFHVLADSGEDAIAYCPDSDYAANIETAETKPSGVNESASEALTKVATTGSKTVDEGAQSMGIAADRIVKTIIVQASEECDADFVALLLRGNQKLNEIKTEKQAEVASPLSFANEEQILALTGATPGSLGPKGLNCPIIADYALQGLADLAIGANETGYHYTGATDGRDFTVTRYADLRNIEAGDPSPCGQGTIDIVRGIEVGHIFQLGTKYSEALKCQVLNENGKAETVTMGCYGIGVSRIVAASIEQQHDDNGIIWPDNIAPFQISIAPLNYHKAEAVKEKADALYAELKAAGVDVLMDDRNIRPGAMFADHDLLGIPHRIVISDRGLGNGELEYKARAADEAENIAVDDALALITSKL